MTAGRITDEAEAWLVLAELIEGGRVLPNYYCACGCRQYLNAVGLCGVVKGSAGIVAPKTVSHMKDRLCRALGDRQLLCAIFKWAPRVKWCRRFAAQVLKERGTA